MQVHDSLCNMTGLTSLRLHRCEIESVSPSISNLRELGRLDHCMNRLAEVRLHACSIISRTCGVGAMLNSSHVILPPFLPSHAGAPGAVHPPKSEGTEHLVQATKMQVNQQSCRFLMHLPDIREVSLAVTKEKQSALAGLVLDMTVRHGRNVLHLVEARAKICRMLMQADRIAHVHQGNGWSLNVPPHWYIGTP